MAVRKRPTTAALLLLTSALVTPAALAQTSPPSGSTPTGDSDGSVDEGPAEEDQAQTERREQENIEISTPGVNNSEPIVVRGRFIPNPIRATSEVVSVLSSEEIARTADGDIAGSLQRVTGLSVVGGRFVFVRGLGERYSLALLNGSPLPSPEPLRRVVPLDLFPTSVIASTVVQKSYSVNYPGEFGGGVINLTSKSAPEETFIKFGAGIGGDSETTGELGYTYFGSDSDFTGFDDGSRDIPAGLAAALAQNVPIAAGVNFTSEQLQGFGASLLNAPTSLVQRNNNIPANFSAEVTAGTTIAAGASDIGLIATAGFSNSWRTRGGTQQITQGIVQIDGQDGLLPDSDFQFLTTENRVVVNALASASLAFDEHKIRFVNVFIRDTLKDASIKQGVDAISVDEATILNQSRTSWFERQLFTTQLTGEFKFGDMAVDVRGSYANSQREAPYERTFSYAFNPDLLGSGVGDFVNDLTSPGQSARIRFSDLNDEVYGVGLDFGYKLATAMPITLSGGYNYYLNERNASRRDFRFVPTVAVPEGADQMRPDFLLSDASIAAYGIELREVASQTSVPSYDAELEILGTYVQADIEPADGVRMNFGVRYETADQMVTPLSLAGTGSSVFPTSLSNDYFLPAATITWNFAEDMQVRLAASKTIARPQFRELAPQQFLDLDTDRTFIGNPLLQDSQLFNAEGRYEYYIGQGERITLAAFFKRIDNPIENVAFVQGGGTLFTGFSNAPKANLYGIEAELVKYFPLYALGDGFFSERRMIFAGNYTYTKSEIKVGESDISVNPVTLEPTASANIFDDGDRLTGQSRHVANVQLGLESEGDRLSQQTILLTYNSPRVTARGPQNQPDLIETSGVRLDFVWREGFQLFGSDGEIKLEVRNILSEDYSEAQTLGASRIINNGYDIGTSVSLGASMQF